MDSNCPSETASPPAIELGEEMVITDEELDRIYGTDTLLTAPTSFINADDFCDDPSDTVETVPDWLSLASQGDFTARKSRQSRAWMGGLVVIGIIAFVAIGLIYTNSYSAAKASEALSVGESEGKTERLITQPGQLTITQKPPSHTIYNGTEFIHFAGDIKNETDKRRQLPVLRLEFFDHMGQAVQTHSMKFSATDISPGESIPYSLQVQAPLENAENAKLSFMGLDIEEHKPRASNLLEIAKSFYDLTKTGPGQGLVFHPNTPERRIFNGAGKFIFSGTIENVTESAIRVPVLMLEILDNQKQNLDVGTLDLTQYLLEPGATIPYNITTDAHRTAQTANLRFLSEEEAALLMKDKHAQ